MPRGTRLGEVVEIVRKTARLSSSSSRGTDHRDTIVADIKRVQQELYDDYAWPFMNLTKEEGRKNISAGERYYDFPANIDIDGTASIWCKSTGQWLPLARGITPDDYNGFDSDLDVRADPVQKWDVHGEAQFEIWPMPATNLTGGLWVRGTKNLTPLVDDNSLLDLDDYLVALKVAAEILAANGQKDAPLKLAAFNTRLRALKSSVEARPEIQVGLGRPTTLRGRRLLTGVYNDRT